MAMNFPNAPAVGAIYQAPGGPTYKWDGSMWIPQQGILPAYQLHGGVRIGRVDNSTMSITPVNGGMLIIDNVSRPVVALNKSLSGITPDVVRYIYAFWTGTAIDYEWSGTGHVTTANGIEVKSGDPTRTLVGMIIYSSIYFFADSDTVRFCLNWFEGSKRDVLIRVSPATATVTSTSQTPIGTGYALAWAGTAITADLTGYFYSSGGANVLPVGGIMIDGTNSGAECHAWMTVANAYGQCAASGGLTIATDKSFTLQPTGRVGGGTSFQMGVQLIAKLRM